MADFTHYTNYVPDYGVNGVIFSAGKTVLEVELNELQEINKRESRKSLSSAIGNGAIVSPYSIGSVPTTGSYTIMAGAKFILNGIVIFVENDITITGITNESIWLNVVEFEGTFATVIKKNGDITATAGTNWFKDGRGESETTRRIVMQFSFDKYKKETNIDYPDLSNIKNIYNMEIVRFNAGVRKQTVVPILREYIIDLDLQRSAWVAGTVAGTFTQSISHHLINEGSEPMLVKGIHDATPEAQSAYMKAFGIVSSGTATVTNYTVTFTVYKQPATDVPIRLLYRGL